ncbi:MAG: transcriptional regulator [Oleiphilus sp.]|nr:MAG: transcriptional regulator [Oleiphilus sp.]
MAEERALVVDVCSDASKSLATVKTQRQSTCNACQLKSTCGQSLISKIMSGQGIELDVPNTLNAKRGDVVILSIPERGLLKASMMMFLMPLVLMMFVAALCKLFFDWPEPAIALVGLLGLGAGFLLAKMMAASMQDDPAFQPKMTGFALSASEAMSCHQDTRIPVALRDG